MFKKSCITNIEQQYLGGIKYQCEPFLYFQLGVIIHLKQRL